jgi:hypothetical protein
LVGSWARYLNRAPLPRKMPGKQKQLIIVDRDLKNTQLRIKGDLP